MHVKARLNKSGFFGRFSAFDDDENREKSILFQLHIFTLVIVRASK